MMDQPPPPDDPDVVYDRLTNALIAAIKRRPNFDALVAEMWEIVKDHPDDCECLDCWEYYVFTEK